MDFYVYLNGSQQGPMAFEQLRLLNISPDTPVWYDGLKDWTPAAQAEATASLFNQNPPPFGQQYAYGHNTYGQNAYGQQTPPPHPGQGFNQNGGFAQHMYYQQQQDLPPRPNNYLGWAIAATILCCLPLGIVAIVKAASVNEKYAAGDYKGAQDASDSARTWTWITAGVGLALSVSYYVLLFATSLGSMLLSF